MADRFFPNVMPVFVKEDIQEEDKVTDEDSLMKLLSTPYTSLSKQFQRSGLDLKEKRHEILLQDTRNIHRNSVFVTQKRPMEDLADIKLNHEYDHEELIRIVKLGIACTRSNPELRPSMRQIIRILDGNDQWFMEGGKKKESREEWRQKNACSLSLIRRIQALGIQ